MNYIRNVRILWTLLQFLEFAQPYHKEYTIPVSSIVQLECDDGLKIINDINVTVRRSNTTCLTTSDECTLPNNAIESIEDKCNKHSSCEVDIHDEITNHWCLQDYGYVNFSYACKTITDLSCDFESDECKWSPVPIQNRFRWEYGLLDHNKFPDVDHTSASSTGKYAYIYAADSHRGDIAKLESDTIIATQQQCLSFWYFKTNSRDKVHLLKNDLHLLNLSNYIGKEWHRLQVPLGKTSHNSYKLVFKVERGKNSDGSFGAIVIDDILIANQHCHSSLRECDFDTNECDINNEHSSKYVWRKKNGYNNPYNPETDHTTASKSGYYLYLSIEVYKAEETTAYLEFQNIEIDILVNSCFTFWYYMYGYNGIGGLTVSLDDEHFWRKLGNKDDKWMKGMIDVSKRILNNIKVIGIIGIGWVGDIAIDDLYITEGTCKGLFDHEKKCVHLNDGVPKETFCPRGYLEFKNPLVSFDREKEECSEAYDKTNMRILQECKYRNDSEKCLIDMSTDIRSHPECFQVYELQILHTCEEKEITTVLSNYTSKRDSSADVITVYAVVVSTLVIIIVAVSVFVVIVCHFKKRAKSSKLCNIRQHTSVREMIDSSGYNIINYNKMTGITISDIDTSKLEANATNRQPQDINTPFKQEDTIGNKYESLSTDRNPSEHAYESDPIHSSQYQTLTKQRESDKHFYESTEPAQAQTQDNKTLTGQEDDVCHKYESLSTNQNSVEHAYESDVLHLNQYQTLTTQRESDKHLYESTEPVQKQNIKTFINQDDDICNKYESLSTNRNPNEHVYASDQIHTNQYESLTKQRESDKHKHATKQEDDICNKYESLSTNRNPNEHAYETDSIHNNQYQTLKNQRESDKHVYESTEHALRVSMD